MSTENLRTGNLSFGDLPPDEVLFGRSKVMQGLKRKLERVCTTTVSVVLQGEVGVGKGLLSMFIHQHSAGEPGSYIRFNCAGLSDTSMYVNPFAYIGWNVASGTDVELPSGRGPSITTIFLDQINEVPALYQKRLAHSLAEWEGRQTADALAGRRAVRFTSSSRCSIRQRVKLGRFRRDLFDRVAVVTLDVPPLRERLEDLPGLCEYLSSCSAQEFGVAQKSIPRELMERLRRHPWPGNIRELQNFVCRYVVVGGKSADLDDVDWRRDAPAKGGNTGGSDLQNPTMGPGKIM